MSMTVEEAIEKLEFLNEALNFQRHDADECSCALQMGMDAIKEVQQYRAIGTVSEFRELKGIDEDLRLKYCYEDLSSAENRGYMQGYNTAVNDFANFIHEKAKEKNGLRLSAETRSWTHPSIFDYVDEFEKIEESVENE